MTLHRRRKLPEIDLTAHHEAGHAIARIALNVEGYDFHNVSINRSAHTGAPEAAAEEYMGIVRCVPIRSPKTRMGIDLASLVPNDKARDYWLDRMRRKIIVCVAGPLAELRRRYPRGRKRDMFFRLVFGYRHTCDYQKVEGVLEDYRVLADCDPLWDFFCEALALVDTHWVSGDRLAHALLDCDCFDYEDALVESAWFGTQGAA